MRTLADSIEAGRLTMGVEPETSTLGQREELCRSPGGGQRSAADDGAAPMNRVRIKAGPLGAENVRRNRIRAAPGARASGSAVQVQVWRSSP